RFLPLIGVAAAVSVHCGAEPNPGPVSAVSTVSGLPAVSSTVEKADLYTMPAALRAAHLNARQKDARPDHAMTASGAAWQARNAEHGLAASLDARGIRLHSTRQAGAAAVSFALESYGCAEAPQAAVPTRPRADKNRLEYVRDGVTEWYV